MLKFANLSLSQKRFVMSVLEHNKQYKVGGRITLKECASIYYTLRDQRNGSKNEKIGYPNWLFNKNKVERGVYQLPLPTETDVTSFNKELADKQTPSIVKAKAKVAKLAQAKVVKVKAPKQAQTQKSDALESSRLQKIIDNSIPVNDDVEDFNAILRENGITV